MRRLNRREYQNTLRELLGVEINVSELPADTGTGGFDTVGSNLFMSGNQFEQYLSLGRDAWMRPLTGWPTPQWKRSSAMKPRSSRRSLKSSMRARSMPENAPALGEGRGGSGGQAGERRDRGENPEGLQERRHLPAQLGRDSRCTFA
ncbi:DUF1587 domain-containing protein [Verrucomicrobium spinosum]|uniref:DUF1587 domain-containing protein n=1 Tax=Verrucomicrobium spinosum TaxID=2736 RepID=UPI00210D6BC3|nr:DUF1587 domain-containing protein [Verrucomicrobium spinosum]